MSLTQDELRALKGQIDSATGWWQGPAEYEQTKLDVPRGVLRELLTRYEVTGEELKRDFPVRENYFMVYTDGNAWPVGDNEKTARVMAVSRDAELWAEDKGVRVSHVEKRVMHSFVTKERIEVPLYAE